MTADSPHSAPTEVRDGLRLALTTFTVAPVRAADVNRRTAGVAMTFAPLVGASIGAVVAGLALFLRLGHPPSLLIGALCVATSAALTRGLHLDGLADTVDALGSYRGRDRALAIMKSPDIGPFGVVAIVLALLIPASAIAGLAYDSWWRLLCGLAAAFATGRLAVTWACRKGVPAARPDGLGAMVAGTVGVPALAVATLLVAALAVPADLGQPWHGPISVLAGLAASLLVTWHCVRRFGGVTGDVLGACVEVGTAVAIAGMVV